MALHHATSSEVVDLSPLGSALPDARTRALVKTDSFEAIHLILAAGSEMPPHTVSGKVTLHCLEGRVEVGFQDGAVALGAHDWLYLDGGVLHSVRGVEDSALLLTIMLPAVGASGTAAA